MTTKRIPARSLLDLVVRHALRRPAAIAVSVPPGRGRPSRIEWTYAELLDRARAVGALLAKTRPGEEEPVAALWFARHDPRLLAAQIGCWWAGFAWCALDVRHPAERLRRTVRSAGATLLLAPEEVEPPDVPLPLVPVASERVGEGSAPEGAPVVDPGRLAYVVCTSGTTGEPKAVEIEHRSLLHLVLADLEDFDLVPADRVALSSSPAYDSSIEETWLAFAHGATLVPLDDEQVRSGPDLPALLAEERISVFCPPPTLLAATGEHDPERRLPGLRLLYVGGEPLPTDVAERWARGRRLVNGYGPTECTVTATRGDVRPGEIVTIGRPIGRNRALVVDEDLRPVPDGEEGELLLAGPCLARGYRGRPADTAHAFPKLPGLGRVYRTGDSVVRLPDGRLRFLGRRDDQVKIRGHRIELGDVEAALRSLPGVREAACIAAGDGPRRRLAAFVVGEAAREPGRLKSALAARLPEPMIPATVRGLEALPRLASDKVDRLALARLLSSQESGDPAPRSAERPFRSEDGPVARAAAALAEAIGRPSLGADEDFFEAGGDSLSAALAVSCLREEPGFSGVTVRDLYERRTARALAARAAGEASPHPRTRTTPPIVEEPASRGRFALVQAAALAGGATAGSLGAFVLLAFVLPPVVDALGIAGSLVLIPPLLGLLGLALSFAWIAPVARLSRAWFADLRPGSYPLYGPTHLRLWLFARAASLLPWETLRLVDAVPWLLRRLGARVGRGVTIERGVDFGFLGAGALSLLEIGDLAALGRDAAARLTALDGGRLVVGPVRIGARATLDVRAGTEPGGEVGESAHITPLSVVAAGKPAPAGAIVDGVPARPVGAVDPPSPPRGALSRPRFACLAVLLEIAGALPGYVFALAVWLGLAAARGVDGADVAAWLRHPDANASLLLWLMAGTVAAALLHTLGLALSLRALGTPPVGRHPRRSLASLRAASLGRWVERAGRRLSGTVFWPGFLRAAGARIGRGCEVSSIHGVVPSLMEIGAGSFLADGIYLGTPRQRVAGTEIGPVQLGAGTFLGNHVVAPPGTRLPDGVLLGVATAPPAGPVRPGASLFGHPPVEIARTPDPDADPKTTIRPGPLRFATRLAWEALRYAVDLPLVVWAVVTYSLALGPSGAETPLLASATRWLLVSLPALALPPLFVAAAKWALLGRVRPGRHPLWSCFCSRWDFLYVLWDRAARPFLAPLEGSPLLHGWLRLFGVRIGRGVHLGGGFAQVVDPDLLVFEEGATVESMFQAHTFEDRVLRMGEVRIGRDATAAAGAVLLYGSSLGARARLGAHSVLWKGERVPDGESVAGHPVRPEAEA